MSYNPIFDDKKKKNNINYGFAKFKQDGSSFRYVDMILEPEKTIVKVKIKDALELRATDKGLQKVHCWLTEHEDSGKSIMGLNIDTISKNGYIYGDQQVCLYGADIKRLKIFLDNFYKIDTSNKREFSVPVEELEKREEIKNKIKSHIQRFSARDIDTILSNIENIEDIAKISAIKQKEKALKDFKRIIDGNYSHETEIERFLENNLWMLGNEFSTFITDKNDEKGNRFDIVAKNYDGFLDVVELKLPKEELFNYDKSHNNYYPQSGLTKTISQLQNYLFCLEKYVRDEYESKNDLSVVKPRGIIIYGTGKELNEDELKYLRVLNSSYHNISIYTYQQVYNRALSIYEKILEES